MGSSGRSCCSNPAIIEKSLGVIINNRLDALVPQGVDRPYILLFRRSGRPARTRYQQDYQN